MKLYALSFFKVILFFFFSSVGSVACHSLSSSEVDSVGVVNNTAMGPVTILPPDCPAPDSDIAIRSIASVQENKLWKLFRERFPYHMQVIGNSEIAADNSCDLLLSEPSPNVTPEGLKNVVGCYSHKITIEQHQIGYDGWIKDVMITLAGVTKSDVDVLKKRLSVYMFNTDYGSYSLPLQTNYATNYLPGLHQNLNYQISPEELDKWFCGPDAIVFDAGTLSQILLTPWNGKSGIHYSRSRGFVAWVLQQNNSIDNEKEMIRKFALDADIVIGAIAKNDQIAIIGRERQTSVFDLPPLRTETILQLAAANDYELAQSYERNNIMACKLPDGRDWAPIYLSDELLNTEYGSLLDITDQLLKSWSQNGETSYDHFVYHAPPKWGFESALSTLMNKKLKNSMLTFNWNTSGAAYQFKRDDHDIIGVNRVGSLPVSYIPDDQSTESNDTYKNVEEYEQKGYNFFSNCNDANLVRAAQYATLYQIFKAYQIKSAGLQSAVFNTFEPLESRALMFIDKIKDLSDDEVQTLATSLIKENIKADLLQRRGKLPANINSVLNEYVESLPGEIFLKAAAIKNLRESFVKLSTNALYESNIIKMIVNRNGVRDPYSYSNSPDGYSIYRDVSRSLAQCGFLKWNFDLLNIDPNELVKDYVAYNSKSPAVWIKTPSVVISKSKYAFIFYGGHNIDAKLLNVELDASIQKGTVNFENGVIKIHPDDQARMTPEMLRKWGVEVKSNELNQFGATHDFSFNGEPPKPPRNIKSVFDDPGIPGDERGFVIGLHDVLEVRRVTENNYLVAGKKISSCEELQQILFAHSANQKGAIEFIDFSHNGVEVRLKGVELQVQMETGVKGKFRNATNDETLQLSNINNGTGRINRNYYVFENDPASGVNSHGNNIISAELAARDNTHHVYLQAEAKSKSFFAKVKQAFTSAFHFSKNNDVDFVKKTYNELLSTGLQKNDFALVLSNTKDCVLCKRDSKNRKVFYAILHKRSLRDNHPNIWLN